ncbi:protein FAM3B [Spea bombifrons]|uniref:protein FAM3B n=1 Tax=Spea bombifrons TaxID=233779 RepID=UPI00234B2F66|nr:protein FAM3B [Spea bombifrons]
MVNYRFLSANSLKVLGLLCASVCAWYLGYLFAELLPEDSVQVAIGNMQKIGLKPVLRAPAPKKQKCGIWTVCSPNELPYRIRSGGGKTFLPEICLDDELLLGGPTKSGDRGINIVAVNHETWKPIDIKTFDMYEGDYSPAMIDFIKNIPGGSLLMISSHDDASTKLSEDAKKLFESLGSREVRNIKFRSAWTFLAAKGAQLPENLEKEKINHSHETKNRYSGWPAEIQIDGCIPKQ